MSPNLPPKSLANYLLKILSFLALTSLFLYCLFLISKSRSFQFFGEIIPRVETDQKIIALTFDDAPTPFSDEVLAILAEKNVKATFYVIGQNLDKYPQAGKNIADAGHELGNHSYSHQRFLLKSLAFVESEIEQTNQLIRDAGFMGEITFRPPYGKKLFLLPCYLSRHDLKTIMVNVEAETYLPKLANEQEKTAFVVDYTIEKTQPGSIILLHPFCEACAFSREALGPIIDGLQAEGYQFVTVSELLENQ